MEPGELRRRKTAATKERDPDCTTIERCGSRGLLVIFSGVVTIIGCRVRAHRVVRTIYFFPTEGTR